MTTELVLSLSQLPGAERRRLLREFDPWRWARETAKIRLPKTPEGSGGLIDLRQHPFLQDVYRERTPEVVFLKGAQLGLSTAAMIRTFWMLNTFPCTAIYTFPTSTDVEKYTQGRINPLITGSTYLSSRIPDVNSVKVKAFVLAPDELLQAREAWPRSRRFEGMTRSTVYFGGASTEKDAISVDADLLVHDEEDLADPQIIEQFESRLDASRFKWKFRLSTPRIPGAGIDRVFKSTDQRHWFLTCPRCGLRFEMAFPGGRWPYSNIEPDPTGWTKLSAAYIEWRDKGSQARYVCHGCGKELPPETRYAGEWVPEKTAQGLPHGYAVSQMAAPWVPASRIIERYANATWKSDFWNLVMGIAWDEGVNAFSDEAILARQDKLTPMAASSTDECYMGVDVGSKLHVVIGKWDQNRPRTIYIAELDWDASLEVLDKLMTRFNVAVCGIDSGPEIKAVRAFADRWNKYPTKAAPHGRIRVWRVGYGAAAVPGMGAQLRWKEEDGTVLTPRTEILDKSADELLDERILPRFDGSDAWRQYLLHHTNSKRVAEFEKGLEVEKMVKRWVWAEIGPDHLFHAATYEMIARLAPRGFAGVGAGLITTQRGSKAGSAPVWSPRRG